MQQDGDALTQQLETSLRREIAMSWQRSERSGLSPEQTLSNVEIEDFDRQSRLLDAAEPILDRIARDLDGTGYCVLLADRDARLIDMRFGQPRIEERMEVDGAMPGRRFSEDNTGTNSIATVHEMRRPLAVRGDEHYVEALKKFTCYAVPILNPITRRLDGVLDLTALTEHDSPLLGAFVSHAATEMQNRLLERSRASEHQLLREFHAAVERHPGAPVVGVSPGVFLANPVAEGLLDQVDRAVLRNVVQDSRRDRALRMTLSSGLAVQARFERASPTAGVLIMRVESPPVSTGVVVPHDMTGGRATPETVLIRGEVGSGKSHAAAEMFPCAAFLHADALADTPVVAWLRTARQALLEDQPVVIDDIQFLPAAVAHRLGSILRERRAPTVLTQSIDSTTPEHVRVIAARATRTIDLPSLRARPDRVPQLARSMVQRRAPGRNITNEALAELVRRPWPGNLTQLAETIEHALAMARFGDVGVSHLAGPATAAVEELDPLRRAERDTIAGVLSAHGHNKRRAADELHISRTTLYKRMKELGIPG